MHEHLETFGRLQRHSMTRGMPLQDFARARRPENVIGRIDRNAVTGKLLGKDRIGHAFEGINYAGNRRQQDKLVAVHGN